MSRSKYTSDLLSHADILHLWLLTMAIVLDNDPTGYYGRAMETFLTVAEAVHFTGKSRRTITRLATRLAQASSDQVMREKTARGYIWRISRQSLQDAFGNLASPTHPLVDSQQKSISLSTESVPTLEIVRQGYTGMLAMHQEVKQVYEALLQEKEQQIRVLTQELAQTRKGWWARLWGE